MPRPLRLEFSGAVYYATSRDNIREDIVTDRDGWSGSRDVSRAARPCGRLVRVVLPAYCMMDNHSYAVRMELFDYEKGSVRIGCKLDEMSLVDSQKLFNRGCRAISTANPYYFGRMAEEKAALVKIRIFGDEGEALLGRIMPDLIVGGLTESHMTNVLRVWIFLTQGADEPVRKVLIEEQLHRGGRETSFRSRSAANSRQARISSCVRSGKSRRISSSLMPEARYSNTSYTVIRNPLMQGLPPRFAGSMVIRPSYDMMESLAHR
ncbi:MAG: hypothetical protein LZF86_240113 [Nitrospira sp.]|nr:MAG: hypothetical protein LZF86_240113 [Nitrospira sp.]